MAQPAPSLKTEHGRMTMTGQPEESEQQLARRAGVALRPLGHPNSIARATDFWDDRYEGRRLFAEVLGTFFLVLVAVGGGMVNARFGGEAVPYSARVVAPALMVMATILFMGGVSGAHLNPAVSIAFALRRDFPWKRVPMYLVAQFAGATLAALFLRSVINVSAMYGSNYPAHGYSNGAAF